MSKKKEKQKFFESITFDNNDVAKAFVEKCEKTHKIKMIFTGLSLLSTLGYLLFSGLLPGDLFKSIGIIMLPIGFISAFVVNGAGAIKFPFKVAKFCWFVWPYFPIDLVVGAIGFLLGFMGLFVVPIVVCISGVIQSKKNCTLARDYLAINGIDI